MSRFFSSDTPLWRALNKLADLLWLNILFLVCCIPVFTVGAALSAMYSVVFRLRANEEGAISGDFFNAFRENFKQATVLWLIMLAIGLIIFVDFLLLPFLPAAVYEAAFVIVAVIAMLAVMVLSYLFPLQARFENPTRRTMMNALYLATRHLLPTTVVVSLLTALPVLLAYFLPGLMIQFLPLVVTILFSGIAFVKSFFLKPVFQKYIDLQNAAMQRAEEV